MDIGELLSDHGDSVCHKETYPDHQIVALRGKTGEVRNIICLAGGLLHTAFHIGVILHGSLKAHVSKVVEAFVVEATRIGYQSNFDCWFIAAGTATSGGAAGAEHRHH